MKKNLSILIYSLASGGAERVVSVLLNELKDKYNITLVLMNDAIFYDIPKNLQIIYLENSNPNESGIKKLLKLPFLGYRYKQICENNDIDISLSFMNRPNYINIISKFFANNSKSIISERAMPSLQHKSGLQGLINRFLIKYLYNKSDLITANSKGNSVDLTANFNIKKVITIYNLFDIKKIAEQAKDDIESKYNGFVFVTVGRLDDGKNHQLIIDAMQDVNAQLYIIGEGELRGKLENQIKTLNLENKVFLLGRQKNPYKYLAKADCFVFSSNYEGFPNVLLEALACGLPVISTDCQSGPREILAPNSDIEVQLQNDLELAKYGILTPINNVQKLKEAMELIMNDNELRKNYKETAKQRTDDFRIEQIIKQYEEIICVG
ncbi:MAG: glycosyltransferase [Sulfurospirillum sp.]